MILLHLVCERLRQRRRQSASELGSGAEADGERDHAVVGGRGGVIGKERPKRLRDRGIPRLTQGIAAFEIKAAKSCNRNFQAATATGVGRGDRNRRAKPPLSRRNQPSSAGLPAARPAAPTRTARNQSTKLQPQRKPLPNAPNRLLVRRRYWRPRHPARCRGGK